jgi:glycosyltransferase involved in cell wall biosynthesis
MKRRIPLLFLLSDILGNRTISFRLLDAAGPAYTRNASLVWLTAEDYRRFRAPPLVRRVSTLETAHVVSALVNSLREIPDIAVINGTELGMAASSRFPMAKLIVALDTTPAAASRLHAMTGERPHRWALKKPLAMLREAQFMKFSRRVLHWLPISKTCLQSLTLDYNIRESKCTVTRAPQLDVAPSESLRTCASDRPRLLFVGNDWVRKGADILLEAFSQSLQSYFELTMISNVPPSAKLVSSQRARHIRGLNDPTQLRELYRSHDLLVLPTRYDMYPNVISEGLSQGLPFLATALPGIAEIISESKAGSSLPIGASAADIATAVRELFSNADQYAQFRVNALDYANRFLRLELLSAALQGVLSGAHLAHPL